VKILLVDDEELARQRLRGLIAQLRDGHDVLAEAENGEQAVKLCQQLPIDLVFMDIHMPGMNGLEAAARISEQKMPPAIIFVTAYSEHALDAFEVNAVDYLLKPIRREKLKISLEKATRLTRPQLQQEESSETWLTSRYRGGLQRIAMSDIYYFRADSKYVLVKYKDGEALIEDSLVSLEKRFPGELLRIHRGTLVRMEKVAGLEKREDGGIQLYFPDIDDQLEISRRHVPAVRRLLGRGN
jgi:two-component system response regulator AlgR